MSSVGSMEAILVYSLHMLEIWLTSICTCTSDFFWWLEGVGSTHLVPSSTVQNFLCFFGRGPPLLLTAALLCGSSTSISMQQ